MNFGDWERIINFSYLEPQYSHLQVIGHGGSGVVYRGLNKKSGEEVAIKVIHLKHRSYLKLYKREVKIHSRLHHPNICKLLAKRNHLRLNVRQMSSLNVGMNGGGSGGDDGGDDGDHHSTNILSPFLKCKKKKLIAVCELERMDTDLLSVLMNPHSHCSFSHHPHSSIVNNNNNNNNNDNSDNNNRSSYFEVDDEEEIFSTECELTILQKREIFLEICKAVQYLHSKGIAHLDLKPENVLLQLQPHQQHSLRISQVKLSDFGCAQKCRISKDGSFVACFSNQQSFGTLQYLPPECISLRSSSSSLPLYLDKVDMYALGVLLFVLFTSTFPKIYDVESYCLLASQNLNSVRHLIPSDYFDLVCHLLCDEPLLRPSIFEIVNFFS